MAGVAKETVTDDAERVSVEEPATDGEAVSKSLGHVSAIVADITKALGLKVDVTTDTTTETGTAKAKKKAAGDEEDDEEMSMKSLMKALGLEMNADTEKKLKAAGFDPNQKFPTGKPPASGATKTSKAATSDEGEGVLDDVLASIAKAKKFTPARMQKMKSAFDILKGLLEEIDEVPQGTMPGVSPGGSTQFGASGVKTLAAGSDGTGVQKSSDVNGQLVNLLTEMTSVLKNLATKEDVTTLKTELEDVKKARPASESLEGKGGTETKTQKNGNLWNGVL